MSRFPKLSETFVLFELLAIEQQGIDVELYPLLRERGALMHPEAAELVGRAHYHPFVSWPILRSQLHFLRRSPGRYLRTLGTLLTSTWGSLNLFVGAIGIWPKVVHMARLMAADGVTHVHCHFATHPTAAGWIIRRLIGIPYSFTAHGSDLHVERRMLSRKVAEAAFVIAISEYNRNVILAEYRPEGAPDGNENVLVLHCGVDPDVFRPPAQARENETLHVLCIGTLHEVKGQRYLLEACRLLRDQGVDVHCTLVGDGPDLRMLERTLARLELGSGVDLAGRKTRDEVAKLLAGCDVAVTPSVPTRQGKREGIPVVLMEAMSAGVPVVASRLSGIPELVEDERTGLLVPPRDPLALASALRRLHNDSQLRRRLGIAGRDKVVSEFNLHANAERLADLFRETTQRFAERPVSRSRRRRLTRASHPCKPQDDQRNPGAASLARFRHTISALSNVSAAGRKQV
ncbi:MAG: glycosyltransferase [Egibacteraceae bacterium]